MKRTLASDHHVLTININRHGTANPTMPSPNRNNQRDGGPPQKRLNPVSSLSMAAPTYSSSTSPAGAVLGRTAISSTSPLHSCFSVEVSVGSSSNLPVSAHFSTILTPQSHQIRYPSTLFRRWSSFSSASSCRSITNTLPSPPRSTHNGVHSWLAPPYSVF